MLCFDAYPWKSDYTTRTPLAGPPTSWYGDLRRYREHARDAGVPLGCYMQTFHAVQDYDQTVYRDPSPSELRLNHFGALAFNAKVLIDFTYNTGASSLFTTPGGDSKSSMLSFDQTLDAAAESAMFGTPDEISEKLAKLRAAGVQHVLLNGPAGSRENLRALSREVMPAFSGPAPKAAAARPKPQLVNT